MVTTTGDKQNPSLQGRRVMLIYKTHMHPDASLNLEHCTPKSDAGAKNHWLHAHTKSIDKYEDVYSPKPIEGDTNMEEDTTHTEKAAPAEQGLPPSSTGHQQGNAMEENDRKVAADHFNLVPLAAPLNPYPLQYQARDIP